MSRRARMVVLCDAAPDLLSPSRRAVLEGLPRRTLGADWRLAAVIDLDRDPGALDPWARERRARDAAYRSADRDAQRELDQAVAELGIVLGSYGDRRLGVALLAPDADVRFVVAPAKKNRKT